MCPLCSAIVIASIYGRSDCELTMPSCDDVCMPPQLRALDRSPPSRSPPASATSATETTSSLQATRLGPEFPCLCSGNSGHSSSGATRFTSTKLPSVPKLRESGAKPRCDAVTENPYSFSRVSRGDHDTPAFRYSGSGSNRSLQASSICGHPKVVEYPPR